MGRKELADSGNTLFCRLINGTHPVTELYSVGFRKAGLQSVWNDGLFALSHCTETHDSQLMAVEKVLPRQCEIRDLAPFHQVKHQPF